MLFPPPGAPSTRIVLGLGRSKDSKAKLLNGSWFVCSSPVVVVMMEMVVTAVVVMEECPNS